jgi:hypothetical protein
MSMQWRVRPGRLFRAGWSGVSAAIMTLGALLSGAGLVLALTATPADAATVSCNATLATTPLVPGDSGSCTFSYAETAAQAQNQPFTVTLGVNTVSKSGNGAAASGTATEALFDGQATGLQVSVSDSSGNTFGIGTPSCTGTYPDATSCSSTDESQVVPGASSVSSWSDTVTVSWSLPLAAGNPYEGGSATVTVTAYYNGTAAPSPSPRLLLPSPTGGALAATSSPTPAGAVSAVSTPSTGAGPTSTASLVLIALGMVLLLIGASGVGWASRSRRRTP